MSRLDRLTRDPKPLYAHDPAGLIDEIVLSSASVHIERLDRANWMLIVENDRAHFHLVVQVGAITEYEMRADGQLLGPTDTWAAA